MKLRTGDAWMPADEYGRSLKGLTVNLLVRDIEQALVFQTEVLGATVVYSDPDIAVVKGLDAEWMLHADHTCAKHAMQDVIADVSERGAGMELRLHGCDPDEAEAAAQRLGFQVLVGTTDKEAHGLREAFLIDSDGYVWVPDVPL
jgi:catechol 2,3-dioxygenase-like lactoylglutathione lyase family enzyme